MLDNMPRDASMFRLVPLYILEPTLQIGQQAACGNLIADHPNDAGDGPDRLAPRMPEPRTVQMEHLDGLASNIWS